MLLNSKKFRLFLGMSCILAILSGCSDEPENPIAKIEAVIDLVEVAAEKNSVPLFSEHISKQYQDQHHSNRQRVYVQYHGNVIRMF